MTEPGPEDLVGAWLTTPTRTLPPLPRRTRLRLAAHRRIDQLAAWLCGHHAVGAAERLWRACRMI